jgi:hypothetical protein
LANTGVRPGRSKDQIKLDERIKMLKRPVFNLISILAVISTVWLLIPVEVSAVAISLNISSGKPGTVISVSGSGFSNSTAGYIWFDNDGDSFKDTDDPQKSITTTSSGAIPSGSTLTIPVIFSGTYQVRADIPSGGNIEASTGFTIIAGINVSPSSVIMDTPTTVTISGGGFAAGNSGNIWFDTDGDSVTDAGEPQLSITTNTVGAIPATTTLDIPGLPPSKSYYIRADIPAGGSVEASTSFTTSNVTTSLIITKYDAYGGVIGTPITKTWQWLEANLQIRGDGATKYYCEGPYFSADYDTLWDTNEMSSNKNLRDFGKPKGSDVKDLCDLAGGAAPGDTITLKASDNFAKTFDYESIYNPPAGIGKVAVCWYNTDYGGYVPAYGTGMRLLFLTEIPNGDGELVFGDWDMHEYLPKSRWYFYNNTNPSSGGISVQNVYNIEIRQPKLFSCDASGNTKDSFIPGETVYVKGQGLAASTGYKLWIQSEPTTITVFDSNDIPTAGTYSFNTGLDPSGGQETIITNGGGDFNTTAIWTVPVSSPPVGSKYDIIADNQATGTVGVFDINDAIDNPGFEGFSLATPLSPFWDLNGDYVCNIGDVVKVGLKWGLTGSVGWIAEDLNNDGVINIGDVVVLGLHWGETW